VGLLQVYVLFQRCYDDDDVVDVAAAGVVDDDGAHFQPKV